MAYRYKEVTMKTYNIQFKSGTSRGRDSYGYNIVSLYVDCIKVAMTVGVGYDMRGTVLGQWLTKNFQDKLRKLPANYGSLDNNEGFYGLCHYHRLPHGFEQVHKVTKENANNTQTCVDGMCGRSAVYRIMAKIGVKVKERE